MFFFTKFTKILVSLYMPLVRIGAEGKSIHQALHQNRCKSIYAIGA